jgi:hypothetical protein
VYFKSKEPTLLVPYPVVAVMAARKTKVKRFSVSMTQKEKAEFLLTGRIPLFYYINITNIIIIMDNEQ